MLHDEKLHKKFAWLLVACLVLAVSPITAFAAATSVTVGSQSGTLTAGTGGSATFTLTTDIAPDNTGITITWYTDAIKTSTVSAPTGIAENAGTVSDTTGSIEITGDATCAEGTYYFAATVDSVESDAATLTVSAADTTAPASPTYAPLGSAINVAIDVAPTLTFSEDLYSDASATAMSATPTGVIKVYVGTDNTGTALVEVTDFSVAYSAQAFTVTFANDLSYSTAYYVELQANSVYDAAGNPINTAEGISFTTIAAPNTDATLSALTYTVDAGEATAVASFDPDTDSYSVQLPYGTSVTGVIALTGTKTDTNANITVNEGATLSDGTGAATITVTAEDGITTNTYTVNFTVTLFSMTVGSESAGGAGYTREITINSDITATTDGKYLVVQYTEGTGTSAKVSVVMIALAADSTSVMVSYQTTGTTVEAWLTDGLPNLTAPDMGATVYADASSAN